MSAPSLSSRASSAQCPPPGSLLLSYAARTDRFHSLTNPSGYIDLSTSENNLSLPFLHKYLSTLPFPPPSNFRYSATHGDPLFLHHLSVFFSRYFLPASFRALPHNFVAAAGAGACVDLLATVLCDPGDVVLLSGPGYPGFARDLCFRAGTELLIARTDVLAKESSECRAKLCRVSVDAFKHAWQDAGEDVRSRVKMMLVCSPNNPTGEVLSPRLIRELVDWARARKLHVVFDEAYALSVYGVGSRFCSVATALNGELAGDVHVVWTFSKDFCWSGARVGVVYSQNEDVLNALRPALAYLAGASRHAQWALTQMMSDVTWVDTFVLDNREILRQASGETARLLEKYEIPFFPAEAGLFLWIDLRAWMKEETKEEEMALWRRMAEQKVLLTPSCESFGRVSGHFRLCFAACDQHALHVGFERLITVLKHSHAEGTT